MILLLVVGRIERLALDEHADPDAARAPLADDNEREQEARHDHGDDHDRSQLPSVESGDHDPSVAVRPDGETAGMDHTQATILLIEVGIIALLMALGAVGLPRR